MGSSTVGLVRWERLAEVGEALVVTADAPVGAALDAMSVLLDRLTAPHRLLEQLEADADGAIALDPLAAARLRERLSLLARVRPDLIGSGERARTIAGRAEIEVGDAGRGDATLSFDGVVHVAAAAAMATLGHPAAVLDAALDVVVGLALESAAADRLSSGLSGGGRPGVARAVNELRLWGYPLGAGPLGVRAGGVGGLGLPGLPPGLSGLVKGKLGALRGKVVWDPETWDQRPPWQAIAGLPPVVAIDHDEIQRVRCLLDMLQALKLREESPPARPARVVWSDSIAAITADRACEGDRIVIHGHGFGVPSGDVGVTLPTVDGCRAFEVPGEDWTDTAITVTLPPGIVSGPVGLVDLAYVDRYDRWAADMSALTKRILDDAKCSRAKAPDVAYVPAFGECAPPTPVNRLRAGLPVVRSFTINALSRVVVEPGQWLRLEWDLQNVDHFQLTRVSGVGPGFAGAPRLDDPPGRLYDLGPFSGDRPLEAVYELRATGPCGDVTVTVRALLRRVPVLRIDGVETTQAIQTFRHPGEQPNSIPLVAGKDTFVRVYVAAENLGGFRPRGAAEEVGVSGALIVNHAGERISLPPLNSSATARPSAEIDRRKRDHTLNFLIPEALASGSTTLTVRVWSQDEIEAPPLGIKTRPATAASHAISWVVKRPFPVRYVRIGHTSAPAKSEDDVRKIVLESFDVLATPPSDIAAARMPTWYSTVDFHTRDGMNELLGHIDDQHDCAISEWLFPWEEECPDADGAVWIGVLPRYGTAATGVAESTSALMRDTVLVSPDRLTTAHELSHILGLKHVNPALTCSAPPEGPYDSLPDGGRIRPEDAWDPRTAAPRALDGYDLHDYMTYDCARWVSAATWLRVMGKF